MTQTHFFHQYHNYSAVASMVRIINNILFIIFIFITINVSQCLAKSSQDSDISTFAENKLFPILIREKLCSSIKDCRDKEYFLCVSWETISCEIYGVSSEKLINEIFLLMLTSRLNIRSLVFWGSTSRKKTFFEKPLLNYINRARG